MDRRQFLVGIPVAALLVQSNLLDASPAAKKKGVMLMNRIGPSAADLYIANADGTAERAHGCAQRDVDDVIEGTPAVREPRKVAPEHAEIVLRGAALFGSTASCSTCHSGAKLTNNTTVDVGTGGAFQVPPLVGVGWRTPLLHNGCASTIADRFGSVCSTKGHGDISKLSSKDIANLTAFLETL